MRIAYFTDTFLPQINGIATSMRSFAEELGKRGHQVLIVTPKPQKGGHPVRWATGNVRVVHLPSMPAFVYPEFRFSPVGYRKLLKALQEFNPDVIHFHTPLFVGWFGVRAAKRLGKPLVGTNHIYLTKDNSEFFRYLIRNHRFRTAFSRGVLRCARAFYQSCDVFISPSAHLIEDLEGQEFRPFVAHLPSGIPCSAVRILGGAERTAMKAQYGLKKHVILHFGRMSKEKNIHQVLDAFALVHAAMQEVSLLLIGDGPAFSSLKDYARELGLAEDIVFTGRIPHETLLSSGLLSVADVFVTASRMESQGMVLIEAMAAGLPVVCANDAGVDEVVEGAGLLVSPGDVGAIAKGLRTILQDHPLKAAMREKSISNAKRYSIEHLTSRLLELYEKAKMRSSQKHEAKLNAHPRTSR